MGDCTAAQTDCREAPHGDGDERQAEIDAVGLDFVTFHSRNLAVPARRDLDGPRVLRGKEVFYETGCTSCHAPKHVTARLEDQPEQNFQPIWPYSDLFLHDMGEGLADSRPEVCADGREWRTAPLWDIGLTELVSGHTQFLHDGWARSLLEAALPHGGEAEAARDRDALFMGVQRRADICGLAHDAGRLSGDGRVGGLIRATADGLVPLTVSDRAWDNHLVAISAA